MLYCDFNAVSQHGCSLPMSVQLPACWLMMRMDELSSLASWVSLAAHSQPAEGAHTPSSPNSALVRFLSYYNKAALVLDICRNKLGT